MSNGFRWSIEFNKFNFTVLSKDYKVMKYQELQNKIFLSNQHFKNFLNILKI